MVFLSDGFTMAVIGNSMMKCPVAMYQTLPRSLSSRGPSIKYVTLFLANFHPPPPVTLRHTSRDPPKVRHTSRTPPPIFRRPSTKIPDKSPLVQILSQFFARFFVRWFCQGVFCLEGFVRGGFCPNACSVRIHLLHQKVKHHFKFHVSYVCSLPPPSVTNCHTFSDPSSLKRDVLYGRPLKIK